MQRRSMYPPSPRASPPILQSLRASPTILQSLQESPPFLLQRRPMHQRSHQASSLVPRTHLLQQRKQICQPSLQAVLIRPSPQALTLVAGPHRQLAEGKLLVSKGVVPKSFPLGRGLKLNHYIQAAIIIMSQRKPRSAKCSRHSPTGALTWIQPGRKLSAVCMGLAHDLSSRTLC